MTASNTGEKQANKGQFKKGDPRINRKGRPKSFDQLRILAQQLSNEVAVDAQGKPLIRDGRATTQTEVILLKLMRENPERFLEIAFGKVPQPVEMTGKDGGPQVIKVTLVND